MSKKLTHQEYIEKLLIKNPTIEPLESYIDSHTPILHKCKVCGNKWKIQPANAMSNRGGNGCPICQRHSISIRSIKPLSQYLKELKEKNSSLEYVSGYINATTKCLHKCMICGGDVIIDPSHVLSGNGCAKCGIRKMADSCRKTHEQFINEVTNVLDHNIKIMGRYVNSKTPIECICINCNKTIYKLPNELLKGTGCQKCSAIESGKRQKKTTEQFKCELKDINPLIEVISIYKGASEHIDIKCKICGHKWSAYPSNLLKGAGCPECAKIRGAEKKKQTTLKDYLKYFEKHNLKLLEEYKGTVDNHKFKCTFCGLEFYGTPHKIIQGNKGCPVCSGNSSGERVIYQFLYKNNIDYEPEKSFDDLRSFSGGYLRYDFYLPYYNLLLEFHGSQHEGPKNGYFGGEKGYEKQHKHDMIKEKYAKDKGYDFLVIWYYDIDNIERILTDYLHLNSESVETVTDI